MRAVITGATKGIGRAVAEALAAEGYDLAVCARTKADLDTLKQDLESRFEGISVLTMPCDMGVKAQVYAFAGFVAGQWDSLDVLVNNAGLFLPGKITEQDDADFEHVIQMNFFSAYYMTKGLLSLLRNPDSAYIIQISSIAALMAYENGGAYGIAKAAMLSFSRTLRAELKHENIKVTAVLPGATYTDSWASSGLPESRFMTVEDVAACVVTALKMSSTAVLEEIILRPQLGDI